MTDVAAGGQGRKGGGRRKRMLTAEEKYEIWLGLVTGEFSQNEAAERYGVDRSTIVRIRRLAKEAVLEVLAASKPAGPASVRSQHVEYEIRRVVASVRAVEHSLGPCAGGVEVATQVGVPRRGCRSRGARPHWEGDLVRGTGGSAVGTLVERTSRLLLLVKLDKVDAETVSAALRQHILTLPEHLRRSLTWDQGKEMGRHAQFTIDTGVQVYFCDPKSPGSVAAARTPTGWCASTCRSAPTSSPTARLNSTPPSSSTRVLADSRICDTIREVHRGCCADPLSSLHRMVRVDVGGYGSIRLGNQSGAMSFEGTEGPIQDTEYADQLSADTTADLEELVEMARRREVRRWGVSARCGPFGIPSTSPWTGAAIIV